MAEQVKQRCIVCGKTKEIQFFGWSRKKRRPTKTCQLCWSHPSLKDSTDELVLYYSRIRGLMEELAKAQVAALNDGKPLNRKIASSLGEVFVDEVTEEVYRSIIRALIAKAESGDTRATELLLAERHRRAGEPSPGSVEASFEELFKLAPLTPNLDTA